MARVIRSILKSRVVSVLIVTALVFVFIALAVPKEASAADFSLLVRGKVTDSLGNPISGASVSVTILRTSASSTDPDGTDSNGNYAISPDIDASGYNALDTARVTVTCGLGVKSVDHVITQEEADNGYAIVDVQYDTVIPEFGNALGLIVATFMVGLVALVVIGRKQG